VRANGADYEWAQHVAPSITAGVTDKQRAALERDELTDAAFNPQERAALPLAAAVQGGPQVPDAIFDSYPRRSGYTAGEEAATAALTCVLRSGHTAEDKAEMLEQLWSMFQAHTGIATDQLAISLQEIPSGNAMEMGQTMPGVGQQ
jgi:hypothetical protein